MKNFVYLAFLLFVSEALAQLNPECYVVDITGYYDFSDFDEPGRINNDAKYFRLKTRENEIYDFTICSSIIRNSVETGGRLETGGGKESLIKFEDKPKFKRDSKVS